MAKPKKWVRNVKTVSTYPPKDLFTKDAQTIAKTMAKKSVSPGGLGSGIRMIQYFINRAGKSLSTDSKTGIGESKKDPAKKEKKHQKRGQVAMNLRYIFFIVLALGWMSALVACPNTLSKLKQRRRQPAWAARAPQTPNWRKP